MATFDEHIEASVEFQKEIAASGLKALKELGKTLKEVGEKVGDSKEEPSEVVADTILGIAEAHSAFRAGAVTAATNAFKKVRKKVPGKR